MHRKCHLSHCHRRATKNGKCDEHQGVIKPKREFDTDSFYSTKRWTNLSLYIRQAQPICQCCGFAASTLADHIYERRWNDGTYYETDELNLIGLCDKCHGLKTHTVKRTLKNGHPTKETILAMESLYAGSQGEAQIKQAIEYYFRPHLHD